MLERLEGLAEPLGEEAKSKKDDAGDKEGKRAVLALFYGLFVCFFGCHIAFNIA